MPDVLPVVNGRKFGRLPQFDPRSRNFAIRRLLATQPFRSFSWACNIFLDQGQEGSCVGFGWAHELAARPVPIRGLTATFAHDRIYKVAQTLDDTPGENYEGTSVLAGAKAVELLGAMDQYRWAFGLDDLRLAVGHAGPAVLGVNWYSGMYDPDSQGFIHKVGELAGGHCILCYGVSERSKFFRLHNSWGADWGAGGTCKISFDDMDNLLHEAGEACIPVDRKKITVTSA